MEKVVGCRARTWWGWAGMKPCSPPPAMAELSPPLMFMPFAAAAAAACCAAIIIAILIAKRE